MDISKLPFSPSVRRANLLFLSGQVGLKDGVLCAGTVAAQTAQAMRNIGTLLESNAFGLHDIADVTVFLVDMGDYQEMNKIYEEVFRNEGVTELPTRTCVAVKELPLRALVEIKVIATVR